jgi:hypothetical protein
MLEMRCSGWLRSSRATYDGQLLVIEQEEAVNK